MTPSARSTRYLREQGYHVANVEKYVKPKFKQGFKMDVFGWIDLVAVDPKRTGVLGVQTTTSSNFAARLKKARGNEHLVAWLVASNHLVVHGWRKLKGRWTVREYDVTMRDCMALEYLTDAGVETVARDIV